MCHGTRRPTPRRAAARQRLQDARKKMQPGAAMAVDAPLDITAAMTVPAPQAAMLLLATPSRRGPPSAARVGHSTALADPGFAARR